MPRPASSSGSPSHGSEPSGPPANDAFDPALWEMFVSTTLGLEVPILAALPTPP